MEVKDNEKDLLVPDHEFDGIKEFDNPPPPWIMWIFYITIFFGALYMAHYHWLKQGDLQETRYSKQIAEIEAKNKSKTADSVPLAIFTDNINLEEGRNLFNEKLCIQCHGKLGEGSSIGPNLTDNYWIHGNSLENIMKIIQFGVAEKGMPPYKDQISDKKIIQLASFILISLKGSNPPNAKEPQGNLITEK